MELRPLGGTLRIVAPNTNTHAKNKVALCKKVSLIKTTNIEWPQFNAITTTH